MGRRFGKPKALADTGSGPWVVRAVATVAELDTRIVVTGAAADDVEALLPDGVVAVRNADFASGMGSSLRAGLAALPADIDAALVTLVDLPDVSAAVVARVLGSIDPANPRASLARAAYHGAPGHPVLIGANHVPPILDVARGDRGARDYLARSEVTLVDCSDLASGVDCDTPTHR